MFENNILVYLNIIMLKYILLFINDIILFFFFKNIELNFK
jgi:hypothetical protein